MAIQTELDYLFSKGLENYRPHTDFKIEKGPYVIKLAQTTDELIKTLSLRYAVYGRFYKTHPPVSIDIDDYDKNADHIIVMNKESGDVLGTYRILCSDFVSEYYTEREFNLDEITKLQKKFVEMGRATVSENARSGAVITLLWRGLGEYIQNVKADYLFGCATLWTQDFSYVSDVWSYFKEKKLFFEEEIVPLDQNKIPSWSDLLKDKEKTKFTDEDFKAISKSLPPLFKSYIKAGAKFGLHPANDIKLQSVDFFTICKVDDLSDGIVKKYL